MNRIMDMQHLSESEKHQLMQKEFEELDEEEEEKELEEATSRKRARALPGAERWAGSFDNLKNEDEKCTYLEELAVVLTSEQMYFLNKLREVVSDEDSGAGGDGRGGAGGVGAGSVRRIDAQMAASAEGDARPPPPKSASASARRASASCCVNAMNDTSSRPS